MTDAKISTSHGTLSFRASSGSGLPVLMIHGNSTCKEVFRNQLDGEIGQKFHMIAFDLPGHGDSEDAPDPDRSYNMTGYASAAIELMQNLMIDRYAVLGWSLGGHVALDMIDQHDNLAGVMITGSPPIGRDERSISEGFFDGIEWSLASKRIFTEEDITSFAHMTCGDGAPYDPFLEKAARRTDGRARALMIAKLACGVGLSQHDLAVSSYCPLAVVNGEKDAFINNEYIASLPYKNLWENRVYDLPALGHAPFWEAPEQFNKYLDRFLASL